MKRHSVLIRISAFLWLILILAACSSAANPDSGGVPDTGSSVQTESAAQTVSPIAGASSTEAGQPALAVSCEPTSPDMLGPFYEAGAPERNMVGEGYVLSGTVLSAEGCQPAPNAQIEFWMAGPEGEYRDEYRATLFSDENGAYQFTSHFPPPYSGRPSHIHIRVTADGYKELVTQHYPVTGSTGASFDLVLDDA